LTGWRPDGVAELLLDDEEDAGGGQGEADGDRGAGEGAEEHEGHHDAVGRDADGQLLAESGPGLQDLDVVGLGHHPQHGETGRRAGEPRFFEGSDPVDHEGVRRQLLEHLGPRVDGVPAQGGDGPGRVDPGGEGVGHGLGRLRFEDAHGPHRPGPAVAGLKLAGRGGPFLAPGDQSGHLFLLVGRDASHAVGDLHQRRGQRVAIAGALTRPMVGAVLPGPGESQNDELRDDVGRVGADGHMAGVTARARRQVEEVEDHRDDGRHGHDGEVPVLDVADFVGDDGVEFGFVEPLDEAPGDEHTGVAGRAAEGEGVGGAVIDDGQFHERDPGLLAAPGHALAHRVLEGVALAVVADDHGRHQPLDDERVDGVLNEDHDDRQHDREPHRETDGGHGEEPDGHEEADEATQRRQRTAQDEIHRDGLLQARPTPL
jgi:hypothetical protein